MPGTPSKPLRVVQATWVRYHHFELARELHARDCLEQIFTCLPPWIARRETVPREKISCNFWIQGIRRLLAKAPMYRKSWDGPLACLETATFNRWVAACLPPCNVFIGASGAGLHAGRKVQARGGVYLCDRGSTHYRFQQDLLREEYMRWKQPWCPDPEFLVANEESEYEQADAITVPSNFSKQTFVQAGVPAEKIHVVPYGVNLKEFQPVAEPPRDGTFRILFVGEITLRKGVPYLLEAFRRFQHPRKELILIGGKEKGMEKLLAKLSTPEVRYLGMRPRQELKEEMSRSHVLVLPSVEDGFGMVMGQAMACGCAIIASEHTGARNLYTDGVEGFIIPPRNPGALAAAWTRLADEPSTLAAMRVAARKRACEVGGWHTYADEILNIARCALTPAG